MELAGSVLGLLLLALVAPRGGAGAAVPAGTQDDAPSLCYAFSVSASGPPWCEFLGTINGTPFFEYSCKSRMAKPVGPLWGHPQGMMSNATKSCNQLVEHWKDLVEELRKALLDNKQNISKAFDSLSLQGSMMCEQESNGHRKTFWEFGFKGQTCLRFDLRNKHCTELHPGCRSLKETLGSDRDVTNLLLLVSNGDCVKLLNQSTVLNTKAAPTIAAASASASSPTVSATSTTATTTVPAPSNATNSQNNNISWIIPLTLLIFILPVFVLGYICYNRRRCSGAPESGSTSTRVPSGQTHFHHIQELTRDPQELHPLQRMGRPAEDPDGPAPAAVTSSAP